MQLVSLFRIFSLLALCLALTNCGSGDSVGQPAAATPRPGGVPPVLVDPQDYPSPQLDPDTALRNMGTMVNVDGVEYFQPTTYTSAGEEEWAPYRHGYWAWAEPAAGSAAPEIAGPPESAGPNAGWTWMSYDPWGWMTDHYGVWRHHSEHGWIWLPFGDLHYQPQVVTWIDHGDYVGWFPYDNDERCRESYVAGEALHFDDGFWLGFGVADNFGGPEFRFQIGLAVVTRENVTGRNMMDVLINKRPRELDETSIAVMRGAVAEKHLFAQPGGDPLKAKEFINKGAPNHPAAVTQIGNVKTKGGAKILVAKAVNPVPQDSKNAVKNFPKVDKSGKTIQAHNGAPTLSGAPTVPGKMPGPHVPAKGVGGARDTAPAGTLDQQHHSGGAVAPVGQPFKLNQEHGADLVKANPARIGAQPNPPSLAKPVAASPPSTAVKLTAAQPVGKPLLQAPAPLTPPLGKPALQAPAPVAQPVGKPLLQAPTPLTPTLGKPALQAPAPVAQLVGKPLLQAPTPLTPTLGKPALQAPAPVAPTLARQAAPAPAPVLPTVQTRSAPADRGHQGITNATQDATLSRQANPTPAPSRVSSVECTGKTGPGCAGVSPQKPVDASVRHRQ